MKTIAGIEPGNEVCSNACTQYGVPLWQFVNSCVAAKH